MAENTKVTSELKPQDVAYAGVESEFVVTAQFKNLKLRN